MSLFFIKQIYEISIFGTYYVVESFTDKNLNTNKFYNGPYPDEVALVDFASIMDFDCILSTDKEIKMKSKN